jgi:hypothetical protein
VIQDKVLIPMAQFFYKETESGWGWRSSNFDGKTTWFIGLKSASQRPLRGHSESASQRRHEQGWFHD